ncbi:MAG: LytR C-terminal domain-containing protein [Actinomycetota bacterium]
MQAEHHVDEPGAARVGLVRGILVIVTAIALGAFVLSRANFTDSSVEAVAADAGAALEASAEGTDTDPAPSTTSPGTDTTEAATDGADDPAADGAATDPAADGAATDEDGSDPTAAGVTTTEPAGPAQTSPAEIQVLVLNAEGTKGIAGRGSEVLRAAGYDVLAPKNATQLASASSILYTGGSDAEALAVAAAFGADAGVVGAYDPAAPPINDIGPARVVVVIGQDGALGV